MKSAYKTVLMYGLAHGINDFIAGYLLSAHTVQSLNYEKNTFVFLMYGMLAFGGQLFCGILVDKTKKLKFFSLFSLCLMLCAIALFKVNLIFAIVVSGIASAFIHVCGGAACFFEDNENNTFAGLFTSPGVIGLIFGGILGVHPSNYFLALCIPLLLLIIFMSLQQYNYTPLKKQIKFNFSLETHDYLMIVLLMAISFRSLVWNIAQYFTNNETNKLIGIALAAFVGKLLGGYISDKMDWKKFLYGSTLLSVLFLSFGKDFFIVICIGVACLQSAVPITLVLMQNVLRTMPATASGLALGIALALAGLPLYLETFRLLQQNKIVVFFILILYGAINFITVYKIQEIKKQYPPC